MTSADSFFLPGAAPDLGYSNTRDHPRGADSRDFCEALWRRYAPLADPHFRQNAQTQFLQRFWEMYLAVALLDRGLPVTRHGNEGPEFFVPLGTQRLWIEAVAPGPGEGPDRVPEIAFGRFIAVNVPVEKILLRFTNALAEKRARYAAAVSKGIISRDDLYLLAINGRGIPYAPHGDDSIPYFVQAFLPFGPITLEVDVETFEIARSFRAYRPDVRKLKGADVSTRTFLDSEDSFCSAVLHSAVDCANYPERMGDDFAVLHNPQAEHPIDSAVFVWCTQLSLRENALHREAPS
jgi:hypothetical protein